MRIIGGEMRGRVIRFPSKGWPARPTTDFAREALFNILDNRLDYGEIRALELFGGTGIHSIELASRGCRDITYVERHRDSAKFLRRLSNELQLPIAVFQQDVISFIKSASAVWDYIFADPPYDMPGLLEFPEAVLSADIMAPQGIFVLEHTSKLTFDRQRGFQEARHYGQSVFSFFG